MREYRVTPSSPSSRWRDDPLLLFCVGGGWCIDFDHYLRVVSFLLQLVAQPFNSTSPPVTSRLEGGCRRPSRHDGSRVWYSQRSLPAERRRPVCPIIHALDSALSTCQHLCVCCVGIALTPTGSYSPSRLCEGHRPVSLTYVSI